MSVTPRRPHSLHRMGYNSCRSCLSVCVRRRKHSRKLRTLYSLASGGSHASCAWTRYCVLDNIFRNANLRNWYSRIRSCSSALWIYCNRTSTKLSVSTHPCFTLFKCGINVCMLSSTMPKNVCSYWTGIDTPLIFQGPMSGSV